MCGTLGNILTSIVSNSLFGKRPGARDMTMFRSHVGLHVSENLTFFKYLFQNSTARPSQGLIFGQLLLSCGWEIRFCLYHLRRMEFLRRGPLIDFVFPLIFAYWLLSYFLLFFLLTSYWSLISSYFLLLTSYWFYWPLIDLLFFLISCYWLVITSYFFLLTSFWCLIYLWLTSYWPLIDILFPSDSSLIALYWPYWNLIDFLLTSYWPLETTNKCHFKVPWLCSEHENAHKTQYPLRSRRQVRHWSCRNLVSISYSDNCYWDVVSVWAATTV